MRYASLVCAVLMVLGCENRDSTAPEPAPEPAKKPTPAPVEKPTPAPPEKPEPAPDQTDTGQPPPKQAETSSALLDSTRSAVNQKAPATYKARFETSRGTFVIQVTRSWSPRGADRFYNLVKNGFYDECRFFRVVAGFMAQFGIHGDPKVSAVWRNANIQDDPVRETNARGTISFATAGPNTRTSQVFINFADNKRLDGMGFSPFGRVIEGMDVVDRLYAGYGEGFPRGRGPAQNLLQSQGNEYLKSKFPKLDFVKKATIVE